MTDYTMLLVDLAAITLLTTAIYFRRHRRRALMVAFFGVNVGVYDVSSVLARPEVPLVLGPRLFVLLSLFRLPPTEVSPRALALYLAPLPLGLAPDLGQSLPVARGEHDSRTAPGGKAGRAEADPARGGGDDDDLPVERLLAGARHALLLG